jgi:uncharacterized membrane protein YgdD (TMEM256/DUF423 family)
MITCVVVAPGLGRKYPIPGDADRTNSDEEHAEGTMDRTFLLIAALSGLIGVAAGAFGAHALRSRLTVEMLAVFETGVRYQMYHTLVLLFVALAAARFDGWLIHGAGWAFTAGIVVFSGSLYALALSGVTTLGAITPIGGLAFLVGWGLLAATAVALLPIPRT